MRCGGTAPCTYTVSLSRLPNLPAHPFTFGLCYIHMQTTVLVFAAALADAVN